MPPPNSSTSSSDPPVASAGRRFIVGGFSLKKLVKTTCFFLLFLALFELLIWAAFTKTGLAEESMRRYLWYGTSFEAKLREMVNTPNQPDSSVLYAGWLGDDRLRSLPKEADLTVYGMSFSANLGKAKRVAAAVIATFRRWTGLAS